MRRPLVLLCAGLLGTAPLAVALAAPGTAGAATCTRTSADIDRDHFADCWEGANGLTVGVVDKNVDTDHDGLRTRTEYSIDARAAGRTGELVGHYYANDDDSNDNGVEDGDEDLDGDTLSNENELESHTSMFRSDSDRDLLNDAVDDTDHDGLSNEFESEATDLDGDHVGVDDSVDSDHDGVDDANEDFDCDHVVNAKELRPTNADSDRDGTGDATDDSDNDGVDNGSEMLLDDHGLDADSDDDGVSDGTSDSNHDGVEDGTQDGHPDDVEGDGTCTTGVDDHGGHGTDG
jgi:hypothetical protein